MSIRSFYHLIQTLGSRPGYIYKITSMSKEKYKPDSRLQNLADTEDATPSKNAEKLVTVKKKDTAEDKENEFLLHDKPSDEQMHESFDDLREDHLDEEAD